MKRDNEFITKCRTLLDKRWKAVSQAAQKGKTSAELPPEAKRLRSLVQDCLKSASKSYHYVLPTQILSKCVNPRLDCRSLQAAYDATGAFDARTVAHQVVVPFDQANHRVLGGSSEPYVNNPLRCPAIVPKYRAQQKNKEDWDKLAAVLDAIEKTGSAKFTALVLDEVLYAIYSLMAEACVVYPVPNRISLRDTIRLASEFTAVKSGGERVEVVCAALFQAVAGQFKLFEEVRRRPINAPDVASGMGADIECLSRGQVVLLVEVKDRSLTLTQLDAKLDRARAQRISEILFLAEQGIEKTDRKRAEARINSEFASGQNVYVSNFMDFSAGILILLGEKGRVRFLTSVGEELDRTNAAIVHRQTWANLLRSA